MKQSVRFVGCVVLVAVIAQWQGCNNASPPGTDAQSKFPEFLVGVWEAQAGTDPAVKWGFKFEPDGSISKLIHVIAGPINVRDGGAYLEGPDPNTYARFDLGPCDAQYDAATRELSVAVVLDYYRMVLEATRERVRRGEGVVDEEKIRLYFHNIPLWFNLQIIDWLASQGAVVAMDFYTNHVWHGFFFDGGRFDSEDPFKDLALKWLSFDNHVGLPVKLSRSLSSAREWGCQGAIFFSNRSCKVYSIGQPEQMRALEQELGIRSFTFEAEMADPRSFSMDRWKEQVGIFLDFLVAAKR